MAIEVRELIIKMTVEHKARETKAVAGQLDEETKSRLIKECVEKVIEKLESKFQR